jgi:hypothetical protein
MTFERSTPALPEPPPPPSPRAAGDLTGNRPAPAGPAAPSPIQLRLQILSTEHWSLLASRGLAWNEIFSRAGMYLSTLSGSIVALGLIAGVDGFHDAFFVFAIVILPVVLFVGLGTWVRMGAANYHDAMTVFGMNRIRGAYLEMAPDLEPYFVMGVHDDPIGIGITMGVPPGTPTMVHLLASTPFLIIVLNSVVAGAISATALVRFLAPDVIVVVVVAVAVAVAVGLTQVRSAAKRIRAGQLVVKPMFPTPGTENDTTRVFGTDIPTFTGTPTASGADRVAPPEPEA